MTDYILPEGETDPDEKRDEIDDEGYDWETEWLLDEGEDLTIQQDPSLDLDARLNHVDYDHFNKIISLQNLHWNLLIS